MFVCWFLFCFIYLDPGQINGIHHGALKKLDRGGVPLQQAFQLQIGFFPAHNIYGTERAKISTIIERVEKTRRSSLLPIISIAPHAYVYLYIKGLLKGKKPCIFLFANLTRLRPAKYYLFSSFFLFRT